MSRPGADGSDAFGRAMQAMALHRELDRLPGFMKTPAIRQVLVPAAHDASCLGPLFGEMAAAMVAGGAPGGR